MFTSHLSVSEFALAVSDGWTPLGVVTGCFVGTIGEEPDVPEGASRELAPATRRRQKGLEAALDHLCRNAAKQKAAGVVGVRLQLQARGPDLCAWTAYGTAVLSPVAHAGLPFLSTLSGQELSALRRAGYRPVGVACGFCAYYQKPRLAVQDQLKPGLFGGPTIAPNLERKDYTRGVYQARQNALARLESGAAGLGADGVLGLTMTTELRPHHAPGTVGRFLIHLTALGSVVVRTDGATPPVSPQVSLSDRNNTQ